MKKIFYSTIAALVLLACSKNDNVRPVDNNEEDSVRVITTCEYLQKYVVSSVYLKNDTGYVYNQGLQNIECLETTADSIFAVNYSEGKDGVGIKDAYRFYRFRVEDVEANEDSLHGTLYKTVFDQDTTYRDKPALFVKYNNEK